MSRIYHISHPSRKAIGKITVPGSKSESNRLLVLKELFFPDLLIYGHSNSRDTICLQQALAETSAVKDIGDAGTAMRFLTAYYAAKEGAEVILQGTTRMNQRPVGVLVEALRKLGADIEFLDKKGFSPLKITGHKLKGGSVELDSGISSQFITALMLIAPGMESGLIIRMKGFSVSAPYIYLTANLMRRLGFQVQVRGEEISIEPFIPSSPDSFSVEPDWSSASYWFLIGLLAEKAEIYLPGFRQHSLQGDAFVSHLFEPLGLESHFIGSGFRLRKGQRHVESNYGISLIHNPDLAQTMAVAFAALQIPATISGLQTLRIKETDRLQAIKTELEKTGARIETGKDYLKILRGIQDLRGVVFDTWEDHRMAMSLAPLGLLHPVSIRNTGVVTKSYQSFWSDLERVGFLIQ